MLKIGFGLMESPWYWLFIIGCLLIAGILYFFQPFIIGWFGEHWTREVLRKLDKEQYKVINNLFIKVNGIYHQIDHVVISKYGIFCIETKQFNGSIKGDKYDKHWIRYMGKKKVKYTNPIRQNYGHVLSLAELLGIDKSSIINVVCIPNGRRIKVTHDGEVVTYDELMNKIHSYTYVVFKNPDKLYDYLKQNNIKSIIKRKAYINKLKRKKRIPEDICPRCGGKLVQRTSQYGDFLGCSNYPLCKYRWDKNKNKRKPD